MSKSLDGVLTKKANTKENIQKNKYKIYAVYGS